MPKHPVLLLDVMDTIVYDPYRKEIPEFFGLELRELADLKHPTAWAEFERDEIGEKAFFDKYLGEDFSVDSEAFREHLRDAYRFVDGMEDLLETLSETYAEVHALSNYPVWYRIIEEKLELSRFLDWSFVSCKTGVRKPNPDVFHNALDTLDAAPRHCLFVDDRTENCAAARELGISAIRFENARQLADQLNL